MENSVVLENQSSAIFSIYKLDIDALVNDEDNNLIFEDKITPLEKVNAFVAIRLANLDSNYIYSNNNHFHTYLFNAGNVAKWKEFIEAFFLHENVSEDVFKTKFPSYIILKEIDNSIYFMTAGLANSIFSNYKEKTFGLDLVPKLIEEDDSIIKHIADHRVYGNRNNVNYVNRIESAFNNEISYEAIYKEMGITAKKDIQRKIGLYVSEDSNDTPISFGAGVHIGKRISANELNNIINTINILYRDDTKINFALGYIVDANRKGMKQSAITENYFEAIDNGTGEIELSYNYELSYNIKDYILVNSKNAELVDVMQKSGVNTLTSIDDIIKIIRYEQSRGKKSRNFMKNYALSFNYQKIKFFDLLEVSHQFNETQVYLIDGIWYVFDTTYLEYLNRKYNALIEESKSHYNGKLLTIDVKFLDKKFINENELKKSIENSTILIDSDEKYYKGIEIADAIYCQENTIYLFHNKSSFDAKGCRDLLGQIDTSSNILLHMMSNYLENFDDTNRYVNDLKKNNTTKTIHVDEFDSLLKSSLTKIVYVAYFTSIIQENKKSNYVKYLIETTHYKLKDRKHGFIVI